MKQKSRRSSSSSSGLKNLLAHLFHPRRSNNHRPRILHPEAFFVFAFMAIAFSALLLPFRFLSQKTGGVLGFASSISASDVIAQTNQQRASAGLGALTTNGKLNQAALSKAQYMFEKQFWAHNAPDGTEPWAFFKRAGYHYSVAGENLARDFSNTGDMMGAWMASPTHRANIMNGKYTEIGVAVVDGNLLGSDTTLVVQLFGKPLGAAAVPKVSDAAKSTVALKLKVVPSPAVKSATDEVGKPTTPDTQASPALQPAASPAELTIQQPADDNKDVLASAVLPITQLKAPPLFSPLQLMKAFFLAMIFVIITTLVYDMFIMSNTNTVRLVGKNLAHLMLFSVVSFLILLLKSGVVG